MICRLTSENREFPASCLKCAEVDCILPGTTKIGKSYQTRRHPKCPLVELTDEEAAAIEEIISAARKRMRQQERAKKNAE